MLIDLHCDTILKLYEDNSKKLAKNDCHIDIKKLIAAESMMQTFAMFVELSQTNHPVQQTLDMIDIYYEELAKNNHAIEPMYTYQDLLDINERGKIAAMLSIEEGGAIDGKMSNLRVFYRLGVRAITLTWNFENAIGYPNARRDKNIGLKPFGVDIVKEMNGLGMIIDVSHLSDGGFYDVLKYSDKPFVATHSNARAVCNHARNLTDDMLKKLAEKGGVTGINLCPPFIHASLDCKIDYIVKHIEHMKNVAGVDVIAIGADFDGMSGKLDIDNIAKMPLLFDTLKKQGFTEEELDKISHKNAMRVLKDILK